MKTRSPFLLALALALPAASPSAFAQAPRSVAPAPNPAAANAASTLVEAPLKRRNGVMVDPKGRGIYTYDGDTELGGPSRCDSRCISLWPPMYAPAHARAYGPFSIVPTTNGRLMWAYKGKPVYRWLADKKRGDANGDGVSGVWRLVRLSDADARQVPAFSAAER